ncbi:MAG TPA: hypothetical protein VEZ20_07345 [Allosphingosinicella sp.]|nr:hypothetical protein [Allosphingosinicella sp.]
MLLFCLMAAAAVGGCGGAEQDELKLQPGAHPLVDNLDVRKSSGNFSTMNLAHGTFRIAGRCLIVDAGAGARTPVFSLPSGFASPLRDGIDLGEGLALDYGKSYPLPGAGPGSPVAEEQAGPCPRETLVIRGIELEPPPERRMPPVAPEGAEAVSGTVAVRDAYGELPRSHTQGASKVSHVLCQGRKKPPHPIS